jgi:hypothetical protein
MWGQPPWLSGGAEVSRRRPDERDVATVEITPSRTKRAIATVALCLITAAALIFILRGRIFRTNQAARIHSLAVLPLPFATETQRHREKLEVFGKRRV